MANSRKRARVRYSLEINFCYEAEREAFVKRLADIRQSLSPPGSVLDNSTLMSALFDAADKGQGPFQSAQPVAGRSFLRNSGKLANYSMLSSIANCICFNGRSVYWR